MTDETKVEDQDGAKTAPAIAKPVLIGRKVGMLQHFKEDGSVVAATVIAAESNVITQVRTRERDGYTAIQLGFGRAKKKEQLSGGERGHLKDLPPLHVLREVRVDDVAGFATGQEIGVDRFNAGDKVHVSGVSKGKGFQGPVHLHHFTRGPKSTARTTCALRGPGVRARHPVAFSKACGWPRARGPTRSPAGTS